MTWPLLFSLTFYHSHPCSLQPHKTTMHFSVVQLFYTCSLFLVLLPILTSISPQNKQTLKKKETLKVPWVLAQVSFLQRGFLICHLQVSCPSFVFSQYPVLVPTMILSHYFELRLFSTRLKLHEGRDSVFHVHHFISSFYILNIHLLKVSCGKKGRILIEYSQHFLGMVIYTAY